VHTAYGMPCYELWEVICLWQCKRHLSTFSDVTWCWCERRPQRLCIDVHYNEPMNYDAQPMSAMSRSHSVGFTKTKSVSVVLWLCKQAPQSVRNADFCVLLLSFYHSSVRWVVTLSRTYKHWQLRKWLITLQDPNIALLDVTSQPSFSDVPNDWSHIFQT